MKPPAAQLRPKDRPHKFRSYCARAIGDAQGLTTHHVETGADRDAGRADEGSTCLVVGSKQLLFRAFVRGRRTVFPTVVVCMSNEYREGIGGIESTLTRPETAPYDGGLGLPSLVAGEKHPYD